MAEQPQRPAPWSEFTKDYPRWLRPLMWLEWLTELAVYHLSRWSFIELLKLVGSFSLLVAIVTYLSGFDARKRALEDQRKAKHYQAWQVINTARGQTSSGGRIGALEELNRDSVSLASLDAAGAWMRGIRLPRANLMAAGLDSAVLIEADFENANLYGASLRGANLSKANLRNAVIVGADLGGAMLIGADLRGAKLTGTNLKDANFFLADLREAYLARTNLEESLLTLANLQRADLSEASLRQATMSSTDLQWVVLRDVRGWRDIKSLDSAIVYGTKSAPSGFIAWALDTMHARSGPVPEEQWATLRRRIDIDMMMQRPGVRR